jgi:TusA-related sulfurtransferase
MEPAVEPSLCLDLRGTPCPRNFIRTKLALETVQPGDWLQVDLDGGEPEEMVASGLEQAGHTVRRQSHPGIATAVRLLIRRDGS